MKTIRCHHGETLARSGSQRFLRHRKQSEGSQAQTTVASTELGRPYRRPHHGPRAPRGRVPLGSIEDRRGSVIIEKTELVGKAARGRTNGNKGRGRDGVVHATDKDEVSWRSSRQRCLMYRAKLEAMATEKKRREECGEIEDTVLVRAAFARCGGCISFLRRNPHSMYDDTM